METKPKALYYNIGLGLILICSILFAVQIHQPDELFMEGANYFWMNYILSAIYFITMIIRHISNHGWRKWKKMDEKVYSVSLVLFSISAHTLNYGAGIEVFAGYATWMNVYVVLMHLAVIAFPFRSKLPEGIQYVLYFMCGAGLILSLYLCVFIAPLVGIGFLLFFVLGFSMHVTVPFWFTVYYIIAGKRKLPLKFSQTAYWSGILLPVIVLAIYTWRWQGVQEGIKDLRAEYQQEYVDIYPEWVFLGQYLSNDPLTQRVITSKAFAQKAFWDQLDFMPSINSRGLEERHDPLAVSAKLFYGEVDLNNEELFNFLNAKYDARHQTHRRLWRGDDLETERVETRVEIYAPYRMAYIEKTIEVYNANRNRRWRWNNQEAVYTFYMPEGAVASSLSLWIEGEERFSRLTTRSKADSAYQTIVGVESRDPALMHWQEGNRLTVTVFPCPAQETRKFKIGITTPLKMEGGQLVLENIYFDGPAPEEAKSKVNISFIGDVPGNYGTVKGTFQEATSGVLEYAGLYKPDWSINFEPLTIPMTGFTFEGNSYHLTEPVKEEVPLKAREVILDINAEWDKKVYRELLEVLEGRSTYVFTPSKTLVTDENQEDVFQQLSRQKFSLLPLHEINDISNTLIISYEPERSLLLQDLEGSIYAENMTSWLQKLEGNVYWYRLNKNVSPLLRSLRELDIVNDAHGDIEKLKDWLNRDVFVNIKTDDNRITLRGADIQIIRTTDSLNQIHSDQTPDDLLRLFAYHDLLRQIGRDYFDKEALEEVWVRQAEEAFIVSPISSLVVLETQADYERFEIEENENTLGNASDKNSGSVPEPHEWVLILLVLAILGYFFGKKYLRAGNQFRVEI